MLYGRPYCTGAFQKFPVVRQEPSKPYSTTQPDVCRQAVAKRAHIKRPGKERDNAIKRADDATWPHMMLASVLAGPGVIDGDQSSRTSRNELRQLRAAGGEIEQLLCEIITGGGFNGFQRPELLVFRPMIESASTPAAS